MSEDSELVDSFVRTRDFLLQQADAVPPALRLTPFVSHWDLMDVLAHLVGWDYTNLQAIEELKAGRIPEFYRHYDPGWATYNQQLIDRHGTQDWQALRSSLRDSQEAIMSALRGLSAEELSRQMSDPGRPRRPVTIAGILRAAIRDEQEHLEQLRTFVALRASTGN